MPIKKRAAIVGESEKNDTLLGLSDFGYRVFILARNERLEQAVSSHADLSLFIIKNTVFVPRGYYTENKALIDEICAFSSLSLKLTETEPRSPYPHDVPFCALNVGDSYVIANKKALAPEIASFCDENNIPIIHTAQGYAKCTSLCFNGAVISADPSALKAAQSISLKVLKISQGEIELPGYAYGFIGGCCGFDGEKIYFCGDISSHPDGNAITEFIRQAGAIPVSLGSHPLYDVGSIFFV